MNLNENGIHLLTKSSTAKLNNCKNDPLPQLRNVIPRRCSTQDHYALHHIHEPQVIHCDKGIFGQSTS